MNTRVGVVLSHPTQYYSPWFRWLAQHTDLKLRVFYLWQFGVTAQRDPQFGTAFQWDIDLLSGYESEFVPNISRDPGTHHFGGLNNPELTQRLAAWAPDMLLLFGYKSRAHLRALAWARARRLRLGRACPVIFRGDSHVLGGREIPVGQRLLLRLLYAQCAQFLPVGRANADYFRRLGVPARKLHFAPHAVDQQLYQDSAQNWGAAVALRKQLHLEPEAPVVLYAGKFLPEKQPVQLMRAFIALRHPRATLVFVGDGPLRPELEQLAAQHPSARIRLLPFANQTEMPARYLLADVFVLPSRGLYETWGLAVNEAMHLGVPALVSDRVGCQQDLVSHGETGWIFPAGDEAALQRGLGDSLQAVMTERTTWRARAQQRVKAYSYARAALGLTEAVRACQTST